ncbi:MAG: porin family protein [Saprospiraceae bacterium]|nr:porin family protein [Saprospiraceae bacterium]
MMRIIAPVLFMIATTTAIGQELGFGVKAGLTFSTITGETDPGESFGYKSGFHVGPTVTLRYTDDFGVRAELLYNQMGHKYEFEGPSYFILRDDQGERIPIKGEKSVSYNTYLSYIDIPLQVYYRFADLIEVYGGANLLILGGGTAGGSLDFQNEGLRDGPIDVQVDYNYNNDDAAGGSGGVGINRIGRRQFEIPNSLGAYYDFNEKDGRAWNTLDYGLHGGFRIMFNDALYLEGRAYFGFNDVSNNDLDLRQAIPEGEDPIQPSQDEDRNRSFTVSLGFSF